MLSVGGGMSSVDLKKRSRKTMITRRREEESMIGVLGIQTEPIEDLEKELLF